MIEAIVKPIRLDNFRLNLHNPWKKPYTGLLWRVDIGNGNTLGWKYNISKDDYVLGASRNFNDRWLFRYEYAHDTRLGEFGLKYKLHDFVSLEYILNKDDSWLRLIGNF